MKETEKTKRALLDAETALSETIKHQQLIELQHQQNISEIVHDIKNPLTAMIGALSLMDANAETPLPRKRQEECVRTMAQTADRLLTICNTLLGEVSESETEDSSEKTIDVTSLVNEIYDLYSADAKSRGITLAAKFAKKLPDVKGDPQQLYRALTNLVSNALKFTPAGGKVDIVTELDEDKKALIMVVRDSGIGMSRDRIKQITNSRSALVSPHDDIGTGLGLNIVNKIVSDLGGRLEILSTENRGTKITIEFARNKTIATGLRPRR